MKSLFIKYKRFFYAIPCVVSALVLFFSVPVSAVDYVWERLSFVPLTNNADSSDRSGAVNQYFFDFSKGTSSLIYEFSPSNYSVRSRWYRGDYSSSSDYSSQCNIYTTNGPYSYSWLSMQAFSSLNGWQNEIKYIQMPNGRYYPFRDVGLINPNLWPSSKQQDGFLLENGKKYTFTLDYSFPVQTRPIDSFVYDFWLILGYEYRVGNDVYYWFDYDLTQFKLLSDNVEYNEKYSAYWDWVCSFHNKPTLWPDDLDLDWLTGNVYIVGVLSDFQINQEDFMQGSGLDDIVLTSFSISDYRGLNPMAGVTGDGNDIGADITDSVDVFLDFSDNIKASISAFDFSTLLNLQSITLTFGQMVGDFFDLPYMTLLLYLSVILGSLSMLGGLGVAVSKKVSSRGDTSAKIKKK